MSVRKQKKGAFDDASLIPNLPTLLEGRASASQRSLLHQRWDQAAREMPILSGEDHLASCTVLPSVRVSLPGRARARVGTKVESEKCKVESSGSRFEVMISGFRVVVCVDLASFETSGFATHHQLTSSLESSPRSGFFGHVMGKCRNRSGWLALACLRQLRARS
jgi:hypothetical protein